ncbi:MAG: acyl-CoA dehydrogenase family protein [Candidatus Sericytochromatia bacterium]|nr:acyl-CoA dehydrogenase family protein [Candidatus Sericytochromatia bacterium]
MAERHEKGRADLQRWQRHQPTNFYADHRQLQRLLRRLMPSARLANHEAHLAHFGAAVATTLDRAAIANNREGNTPRLDRWSPIGERTEGIEHHPSYEACGRAIYEVGRVIAVYAEPPANLHAQALFYLSSHVGEAGHNCPVACTAGIARVLQGPASEALRARYLPGVLSSRWCERLDGAQFLTELQGGSDVGSNAVVAVPDGEALGTTRWRIHGEKWFCSNAGADLILLTARVAGGADGTAGLGLFLLPRRLDDGSVNHFRLRRLKEKLGTRSMPSAEIDFEGAVAYAIGHVEDGFKHVMNNVINTSRLYNTSGCAGIAHRAHLVAAGYAAAREAFGRPIAAYPLVQEMLARTFATHAVLLAGTLTLASALDAVELGLSGEAERGFVRVAVNLAKMASCQHSHRVVLTAIETLGGNGAIESFSVLPRLLRDNVVYENWEGTHNTLVAQTLRDLHRAPLREAMVNGVAGWLRAVPGCAEVLAPAAAALAAFQAAWPAIAAEPDAGLAALLLRPHAEALADTLFAAAYAADLEAEPDADRRAGEREALGLFVAHHLAPLAPVRDRAYAASVARVAALEVPGAG